jgi:anaerobic dimethyl sulfoxide reductase subunit A
VDWKQFQKKPVFRWEIKDPDYAWKRELSRGDNPVKGTASGKIQFYFEPLARGSDFLTKSDVPPGSGQCLGAGKLPPMAQMTLGGKDTFFSEDAGKYPLLLSSPHSVYRVHSFLDNSPLLSNDCYRHAVWMNVSDAQARGVKDGDLVRIYNHLGAMIIPAYVTSRVVPGTVYVFHGAWYQPGEDKSSLMPEGLDTRGAPNLVINNQDLPMTIVGFFPCKGLVEIEKLEVG